MMRLQRRIIFEEEKQHLTIVFATSAVPENFEYEARSVGFTIRALQIYRRTKLSNHIAVECCVHDPQTVTDLKFAFQLAW